MEPGSVKPNRIGLEGATSLTAVAPPEGIGKVRNFTAQLEGATASRRLRPQFFWHGPSGRTEVTSRKKMRTLRSDCQTGILSARRSRHKGGLTLLQEAADGGVALETDGDFVSVAGLGVCACLGQQLRACRPVGLVFGEPPIGGYLLHGVESGAGTMHLRDRQRAIDSDHR